MPKTRWTSIPLRRRTSTNFPGSAPPIRTRSSRAGRTSARTSSCRRASSRKRHTTRSRTRSSPSRS